MPAGSTRQRSPPRSHRRRRTADAPASMTAEDDEAALAQAVREHDFHLDGAGVRHRVEMLIETRHETLAELAHDAGGFDARLVILEALLGRQSGHADVIAGTAVAFGIAQVNDVDVVMISGALRIRLRLRRARLLL